MGAACKAGGKEMTLAEERTEGGEEWTEVYGQRCPVK